MGAMARTRRGFRRCGAPGPVELAIQLPAVASTTRKGSRRGAYAGATNASPSHTQLVNDDNADWPTAAGA